MFFEFVFHFSIAKVPFELDACLRQLRRNEESSEGEHVPVQLRKLVAGKTQGPREEQASGRPSALTFSLHAVLQFPPQSLGSISFQKGLFAITSYPALANFLRTRPHR